MNWKDGPSGNVEDRRDGVRVVTDLLDQATQKLVDAMNNPELKGKEDQLAAIISAIDDAKNKVLNSSVSDNPGDELNKALNDVINALNKTVEELNPLTSVTNRSGLGKKALNQGIEMRDGRKGSGPWVEVVDAEHRGVWFSKKYQLSIMRAKKKRKMYMFMEEAKRRIVIFNGDKAGEVVIYAKGNVRIKTDSELMIDSGSSMTFRAKKIIAFQTDDAAMTLSNGLYTSGVVNAERVNAILTNAKPGDGAGASAAGGLRFGFQERPILPKVLEPKDRAKTYNEPFEECPKEEVEHYAYDPDN
jgi:hypothetical protein